MSTNSKNSNQIEWRVIDKADGRSLGSVFAATRAGALRKARRAVSTPAQFITVGPVWPTTDDDVVATRRRAAGRLADGATFETLTPAERDALAPDEPNLGTARGTARSRRRAAMQRPPVPLDVVFANSRPLITPTFRVHGVITVPFVVEVDARDADTAGKIVESWESVLSFASGVTGVRVSTDHAQHRVESVEPRNVNVRETRDGRTTVRTTCPHPERARRTTIEGHSATVECTACGAVLQA